MWRIYRDSQFSHNTAVPVSGPKVVPVAEQSDLLRAHAKICGVNEKPEDIATNLERIRERIGRVASRSGRRAEEITLVAVSKTVPASRIREAFEVGIRHFGENRVQERESKSVLTAHLDATWHLIGNLQSNKVTRAMRLFHTVDSLDRIALAERLEQGKRDFNTENRESVEDADGGRVARGGRLRVLMEVRLDPGPSKAGADESQLPALVESVLRMPHLELCGLMGVPPYFDDVEKVRPYFRHLRELRDALRAQYGAEMLPVLSMGMSHDFEVAIEEGATEIRIGRALFGARGSA
jgi:pyridoxal phosphate enzyme (YggS family)